MKPDCEKECIGLVHEMCIKNCISPGSLTCHNVLRTCKYCPRKEGCELHPSGCFEERAREQTLFSQTSNKSSDSPIKEDPADSDRVPETETSKDSKDTEASENTSSPPIEELSEEKEKEKAIVDTERALGESYGPIEEDSKNAPPSPSEDSKED